MRFFAQIVDWEPLRTIVWHKKWGFVLPLKRLVSDDPAIRKKISKRMQPLGLGAPP